MPHGSTLRQSAPAGWAAQVCLAVLATPVAAAVVSFLVLHGVWQQCAVQCNERCLPCTPALQVMPPSSPHSPSPHLVSTTTAVCRVAGLKLLLLLLLLLPEPRRSGAGMTRQHCSSRWLAVETTSLPSCRLAPASAPPHPPPPLHPTAVQRRVAGRRLPTLEACGAHTGDTQSGHAASKPAHSPQQCWQVGGACLPGAAARHLHMPHQSACLPAQTLGPWLPACCLAHHDNLPDMRAMASVDSAVVGDDTTHVGCVPIRQALPRSWPETGARPGRPGGGRAI